MQLTGLSEKVFLDRYAAKNPDGSPMEKTPEEMWKRVATAVASIEKTPELRQKWEALFNDAMTDFKFIPGGRILAGAGTGYAVTFYNCFVIPSPKDSRGGIIDSLKEMVEIMSRGGGVGINLSSLRPRGFRVKKVNGFSSGPINWAELFSVATKDIIQQGGSRRGALMEMLWDWHPDIEEFITVKQNLTKLNGANLSVCISDDFMEAVDKDLEWNLVFPDTSDPEYDEKWNGDLKVWKALGKKVIVHKTIKARYIWDKIADAAWKSAEPGVVFMGRCQKYYNNWYWNQVNCVNPCVIGDTKIFTSEGYVSIKDLVGKKPYVYCREENGDLGLRQAEKVWLTRKQVTVVKVDTYKGSLTCTPDHEILTTKGWKEAKNLEHGDKIIGLNRMMKNEQYSAIGLVGNKYHNEHRFLASKFFHVSNKDDVHHKDGNALNNVLSNLEVIEHGQHSIVSNLNHSNWCDRDSFGRYVKKSKHKKKQSYTLQKPIGKNWFVKSVKIIDGLHDVYDMTVPVVHNFIANDMVISNCGEEPLPPYGVCNLGSINLSHLAKWDSIDTPATFDWQLLRKIVPIAVRFLDNVVDMDPYVFPTIKETQLNGERRIGLGTMGLGDLLIKMHLRYGSQESLDFIDKLYREIRDVAYTAGVEIAIEKGAFNKFDKEKYPQGLFIKQLPEKLQQLIAENGIRNSLTLMQAPTGSTSLMANTTSGIEPVFEFEFVRRDRIGEHLMSHYLYALWQEKHPNEKPDWLASASDLIPEDHVKVQAVIQKYVDASISKTVNAPNNHTVEDVKKLYTQAYKLGLKGITYMREGSRQGVLERVKEEPKKEVQSKKRNVVMKGFTYKTETPTGDAYITINNDANENPYEIFVNVGKPGYDIAALADALGRMLSLVLRLEDSTTPRDRVRHLVAQLNGIGGSKSVGFGPNRIRSLPDAISKVLADHFGFKVNGGVVDADVKHASHEEHDPSTYKNKDICPACGDMSFVREEGCSKCYSCGFASC
jgi:ribonucleotide reductase alpha subunit